MIQFFGDYQEIEDILEFLIISFSSESLSMQDRWRNNSLSADFLANYWGTFFPVYDVESHHHCNEVKDAVVYISNELLENAVKFSLKKSKNPIRIGIYLNTSELRFYVTNAVAIENIPHFQSYIKRLIKGDTSEMYLQQLERNALDSEGKSSNLGYLTMLYNYNARLGWKFESNESYTSMTQVITMVSIKVKRP